MLLALDLPPPFQEMGVTAETQAKLLAACALTESPSTTVHGKEK